MIPERYKNAKWEDVPEGIQAFVKAMPSAKNNLYLHGPVGCGKTHIAYGIKQLFTFRVQVWNTAEMLQEIRRDYDRDGYSKGRLEEKLTDNQNRFLLVLDDIGAEKPTDFVTETLYRIINMRYIHKIPTIFTSNYTLSELAERIGDRSASRIAEMCDFIKLTGDDRRLQK